MLINLKQVQNNRFRIKNGKREKREEMNKSAKVQYSILALRFYQEIS